MFVWLRPAMQENSPCAADPCALSASHESIFALFSRFFNKSPMVWPKWFLKKCSEPEYVSRTPENSGSKCWRSSFLRDTVSGSDESADVCDHDQNVPLVTLPTEEHVWWHIGNSNIKDFVLYANLIKTKPQEKDLNCGNQSKLHGILNIQHLIYLQSYRVIHTTTKNIFRSR